MPTDYESMRQELQNALHASTSAKGRELHDIGLKVASLGAKLGRRFEKEGFQQDPSYQRYLAENPRTDWRARWQTLQDWKTHDEQ